MTARARGPTRSAASATRPRSCSAPCPAGRATTARPRSRPVRPRLTAATLCATSTSTSPPARRVPLLPGLPHRARRARRQPRGAHPPRRRRPRRSCRPRPGCWPPPCRTSRTAARGERRAHRPRRRTTTMAGGRRNEPRVRDRRRRHQDRRRRRRRRRHDRRGAAGRVAGAPTSRRSRTPSRTGRASSRSRHDIAAVGRRRGGLHRQGDRATVLFAPNIAWRDVDLKADLEARVDLPVVVENDANAAAWGEFTLRRRPRRRRPAAGHRRHRHRRRDRARRRAATAAPSASAPRSATCASCPTGACAAAATAAASSSTPAAPPWCARPRAAVDARVAAGADACSTGPAATSTGSTGPLITDAARAGDPFARRAARRPRPLAGRGHRVARRRPRPRGRGRSAAA